MDSVNNSSNVRNSSLSTAKRNKKDEFYTQYIDIQKEVNAYLDCNPETFADKVVYCNCDDPYESNFFKFFAANFNRLKLKKLIATSFEGSQIAGEQFKLNELYDSVADKSIPRAIALELCSVVDTNRDGLTNIEDVKQFLEANEHSRTQLQGTGDFRSSECVKYLNEADIIVTNPPFSLFREFVAQLTQYSKQFLIIGNVNAITYKEIFPLIRENKLWLGASIRSGDREFRVPADYPLQAAGWRMDANGNKYIRVKGVRWFTNLDHNKRHEFLQLQTMERNLRFHKKMKGKEAYDRYDNYDAIEVPYTDAIPSDYDGVMGVPITFLDKYNPDQFEILGATQRGCHDLVPDTKKYDDYWEVTKEGKRTGSSGSKTNENANLQGNDGRKNYFINKDGHIIQSAYQRIFIRHRR